MSIGRGSMDLDHGHLECRARVHFQWRATSDAQGR